MTDNVGLEVRRLGGELERVENVEADYNPLLVTMGGSRCISSAKLYVGKLIMR